MRALYNRSIEWGTYEGDNPATRVKPLRESQGRLRYLDLDEEHTLLAAAGEPLRTMVLVGCHAGLMLPSEALTLLSRGRRRPPARRGDCPGGLREVWRDTIGAAESVAACCARRAPRDSVGGC